jgi:DMSO reductase anchor subunit
MAPIPDSVGAHMRRDSPLLWTLVVFVAGSLLFGALRRATEDSSTAVTVLVQVGALAVVVALLVIIIRRLG